MIVYLLISQRSHDASEIYGVFGSFNKALEVRNLTRDSCEIAEVQVDQFTLVQNRLIDITSFVPLKPCLFELRKDTKVLGTYTKEEAFSTLKDLAPFVRAFDGMIVGGPKGDGPATYVAMAIKWEKG